MFVLKKVSLSIKTSYYFKFNYYYWLESCLIRAVILDEGHLAMSGNISDCQDWEVVPLSLVVEVRDAANILPGTGQPPTVKNYLVQNVNSEAVDRASHKQ